MAKVRSRSGALGVWWGEARKPSRCEPTLQTLAWEGIQNSGNFAFYSQHTTTRQGQEARRT